MQTKNFLTPIISRVFFILLLASSFCGMKEMSFAQHAFQTPWIGAYIATWSIHSYDSVNYYSVNNIPWNSFTHMFHFAANVGSDFKVSTQAPFTTSWDEPALAITRAGHAHGKPVLLTVGSSSDQHLRYAIQQPYRNRLIKDLMEVLRKYEYDGFDIDYEINPAGGWGVRDADASDFREFVVQLYDSLQSVHAYYDTTKKPFLTTATIWNLPVFVALENVFDQINLMTYQMAGDWFGVSWHQGAIYSRTNDGSIFAKDKRFNELPSVQSSFLKYLEAGGNKKKLGLGFSLYGLIESGGELNQHKGEGISQPLQKWKSAPSFNHWDYVNNQLKVLQDQYIDTAHSNYKFDSLAQVSYLKIATDDGNPTNEKFISFADTSSAKSFVRFVLENGVGGMILFDLGAGRLSPKHPIREPILQTINNELHQKRD